MTTNTRKSKTVLKLVAVGALALGHQAFAHGAKVEADALSVAATCSCHNAGDCTCKKGECKCSKCGASKKASVINTLQAAEPKFELPKNARLEATGGVFI